MATLYPITTTFQDQTYSSSNKPTTATLKSDVGTIETGHNNLDGVVAEEHNSNGTHKTSVGMTGEIKIWSTGTAPSSWLLCRGQAISRTTYADLFAVIGTDWGVGDGSTTFNVPETQGKMIAGASATDGDFDLADTGGAKTHTLTTAELASHTHTQNAHKHTQNAHGHTQNAHGHGASSNSTGAHTHSYSRPDGGASCTWLSGSDNGALTGRTTGSSGNHSHSITVNNATATNQNTTATNQNTTATNNNTGSGSAHSIMNPFVTFNYIIKT